MDRQLSLKAILWDAWELAKNNIWILLGFTIVQFLALGLIGGAIGLIFGGDGNAGGLTGQVLISLFDAFFSVAFYQVFFKLMDQPGDAEFPDFVPNLLKAFNFLIVKLLVGLVLMFLMVVIATVYFMNSPQIDIDPENPFSPELIPFFILVAIPAIFITIRLCFVTCFIVDQESGSSESISQSWTITQGHFWFILLLFLVMLGINIVGAMLLFVGLLFSVPFSSIILIIAYRHMVNNYTDEEDVLLDEPEDSNGN